MRGVPDTATSSLTNTFIPGLDGTQQVPDKIFLRFLYHSTISVHIATVDNLQLGFHSRLDASQGFPHLILSLLQGDVEILDQISPVFYITLGVGGNQI